MSIQQTSGRLPAGIDSHSLILTSSNGWIDWKEKTINTINICNFGDLLRRNKDRPVQKANETVDEFDNREGLWEDRQVQIIAWIRSRVSASVKPKIQGLETIQKILDELEKHYKPRGSATLLQLDQRYNDITLATCKDVEEFAHNLRTAREDIEALDPSCKIGEPQFILKFLNGLGPAFAFFLTAFDQSHSLLPERDSAGEVTKDAVTFEATVNAALEAERRNGPSREEEKIALVAIRAKMTCSHCHRPGHQKEKCWKLHPELKAEHDQHTRNRRRQKQSLTERQNSNVDSDESSITAAVATLQRFFPTTNSGQSPIEKFSLIATTHSLAPVGAAATTANLSNIHILDSGASCHMVCQRQNFHTMEPYQGSAVKGFGDSRIQPEGSGTYVLQTKTPSGLKELSLSQALYVPNAGFNLISVSALDAMGCTVMVQGGRAIVTKGHHVLLTAVKHSGIYIVDEEKLSLAAFRIADPKLKLWHDRLGHLSENGIKQLMKIATGIRPTLPGDVCEPCAAGKQKQQPHLGSVSKGTCPLESLHADISGPFHVTAADGSRYWSAFLDDFTKMSWVFPIGLKSDFLQTLRQLLDELETPTRRCRFLRLDLGGENVSFELRAYCNNKGIKIIPTSTAQHEQNGAVEALHRVLLAKLTPTLIRGKIDLRWWPHVLTAINYLRTVSPQVGLETTPYEAWYGDRPDLSHLRVLGSRGKALLPPSKIRKMLPKAIDCQLLGYQGNRNYIVLQGNTVKVTPNVVFFEAAKLEQPRSLPEARQTTSHGYIEPPYFQSASQLQQARPTEPPDSITVTAQETPLPSSNESESEGTYTPQSIQSTIHIASIVSESENLIDMFQPGSRVTRSMGQQRIALVTIHAEHAEEPDTYRQAADSTEWEQWLRAMTDEIDSLKENQTWELVDLPQNRKALRGKWVYKVKRDANGMVSRHKARYVVKGFDQREGIDYHETFASVVKSMTYKAIFALAASEDLEIEQMDVKTAFLYGTVDEEIYMQQPEGFSDKTSRVCKLKKALYGLKQAPRIWYKTLTDFLSTLGFAPIPADEAVFVGKGMIIAIYVDDLLLVGPDKTQIQRIKDTLGQAYKMTDLGPCQYYLGIAIRRDRAQRKIWLSQKAYIDKILCRFGMQDCNPVQIPIQPNSMDHDIGRQSTTEEKTIFAQKVGSLMYAMMGTRPDIAFAVSYCSRFLNDPRPSHHQLLTRILRYMKGTSNWSLCYEGKANNLHGYTDADYAGDKSSRRSTAGYLFSLGSGAISWQSKKQPTIALSTCEAEYMGHTQAAKEATWLRTLLQSLFPGLGFTDKPTMIYADNQGAISLSRNPEFHAKTKHIDIQYHFIREKIADGIVGLAHVPSADEIADGLTKPLATDAFFKFRQAVGIVQG
ncbi:Retrovirus-related Pol polyprotein from transposon TNT 1-94 [Cladobotryum mycophilum]|uniref:Retrovirus-related Pol polyprotein from transposon TNT 1-94 n=1 Tax=Cladobotryum mycophilum TaxID=491253 RepID=A0ABR0SVY1_9HYPO